MRPPDGISPELRPDNRLVEKVWNTYIRIPLPWMFRFATYRHWEKQEVGDRHGPDKFRELTPSSHALLAELARLVPDRSAPILDLGCNVGRHLNALWEMGYRSLQGIDVQHAALDLMREIFPEMYAGSVISQGTFEGFLPKVEEQYFDVTFTHGATIELVSPAFPICKLLSRVSRRAIVLAISESGHLYPRLWEREFLRNGFLLTRLSRPILRGDNTSLMTFERLAHCA